MKGKRSSATHSVCIRSINSLDIMVVGKTWSWLGASLEKGYLAAPLESRGSCESDLWQQKHHLQLWRKVETYYSHSKENKYSMLPALLLLNTVHTKLPLVICIRVVKLQFMSHVWISDTGLCSKTAILLILEDSSFPEHHLLFYFSFLYFQGVQDGVQDTFPYFLLTTMLWGGQGW